MLKTSAGHLNGRQSTCLLERCHSFGLCPTFCRQEKRAQKLTLGPEIAGWGGGLPREGVVVEEFVPSLESLFYLDIEGGHWMDNLFVN